MIRLDQVIKNFEECIQALLDKLESRIPGTILGLLWWCFVLFRALLGFTWVFVLRHAPIPKWNEFGENWLVPVFDFASAYLHDRGALQLMYPSSSSHRGQLLRCCAEYGFKVAQLWLGMNRLHLTSSWNPSLTIIFRTLRVIDVFEVTFACNSYVQYFADYAILYHLW